MSPFGHQHEQHGGPPHDGPHHPPGGHDQGRRSPPPPHNPPPQQGPPHSGQGLSTRLDDLAPSAFAFAASASPFLGIRQACLLQPPRLSPSYPSLEPHRRMGLLNRIQEHFQRTPDQTPQQEPEPKQPGTPCGPHPQQLFQGPGGIAAPQNGPAGSLQQDLSGPAPGEGSTEHGEVGGSVQK
ncbi:hypothetical protein JCM8097_004746 [Rhodosporidiobolus ruineniae]